MLRKTTAENHALESMMDDLFSEISDDLAEVINGGVGNCHYQKTTPVIELKSVGTPTGTRL